MLKTITILLALLTASNLAHCEDIRKETKALNKLEQKWADKFHLSDWDISIVIINIDEMNNSCPYSPGGCWGTSTFDYETKTGIIRVLRKDSYTATMRKYLCRVGRTVEQDQKNTLIHELVHQVLGDNNEERAVIILTDAYKY